MVEEKDLEKKEEEIKQKEVVENGEKRRESEIK